MENNKHLNELVNVMRKLADANNELHDVLASYYGEYADNSTKDVSDAFGTLYDVCEKHVLEIVTDDVLGTRKHTNV